MVDEGSIFAGSIAKSRDFLKCTTTWEYILEANHSRMLFRLLSEKESDDLLSVILGLNFTPSGSSPAIR
ncbi:MAG: hypothetical protein Q8P67_02365, partial [archaeon]|nr:hypothetical protein [archaeon]